VVAVLNPVKPSMATTSTPSRHTLGRLASHVLNACLERPSTMSSNARTSIIPNGSEVDDHGHVLVALAGVPPHVLVHADHLTPSNRVGSAIRTRWPSARTALLAVFHDTAKPFGDPGDGQVGDHEAFQRPPQRAAGQLGAGFGSLAHVLAPHMPTLTTPVAAHRDLQGGGPPAERLVRQPTGHGVARGPSHPHRRHHWSGSTTRQASTAR
jgi:hypothetical protein